MCLYRFDHIDFRVKRVLEWRRHCTRQSFVAQKVRADSISIFHILSACVAWSSLIFQREHPRLLFTLSFFRLHSFRVGVLSNVKAVVDMSQSLALPSRLIDM